MMLTKTHVWTTLEVNLLPFLKHKPAAAGVIVKTRAPDESSEPKDEGDAAVEACASDLINAIHSKDTKGVASALRALFEVMENEPKKEESFDFDSQNAKAAQEQE